MILNQQTAAKVAEFLLQIKAVKLNPKEPFTWASGIKSPIYCDNRVILSYPQIRTFVRQQLVEILRESYGRPDVVAGIATGGVPLGSLVAQEMELPFAYVRSKAKEHGLQNMIEGIVNPGQNVILIEDLISTGGSSLKAVDAVRDRQAIVKGVIAIFDYNFPIAKENFEKSNCSYYSLSNFNILATVARDKEFITESDYDMLVEWHSQKV